MLLTDTVAECAQFCKRAGVLAEFPSVFVMHGVDNKVVVQVCGVGVRGHQHLMPRPRFFRKRQSDFVYLLGGHAFRRRKGLHIMIKIHSAFFVMRGLGCHKFRESIFAAAVYAAHQAVAAVLVRNLFLLQTVFDHRFHCADALPRFGNKTNRCHYPFLAIASSCSKIFFCPSIISSKLYDRNAPALIFAVI